MNPMKNKIVVCGAGGFVGSALIARLRKMFDSDQIRAVWSPRRHEVCFDGIENVYADLSVYEECLRATRGAIWVFNLAAKVGGIGYIEKHKASCMLSSLINTNLLRAAQQLRVASYFFSSSSCVYPEGIECLKESDAYPASPIDGYGWEKLFSERMCLAFAEEYGIPVHIARYHGLYGPGDVREESKDHVIAALCRKVVAAKLSGRYEINIWGDGTQTRSFLYIDDCVEGTLKMVEKDVHGPVNMANSECVSVGKIVELLEEIAGVRLAKFYSMESAIGRRAKCTDNTLIRELLNWEPSTPIRTGLERTYRDCWDRAIKSGK